MDREPERRPRGRDHRVDAARYRVDGDVPSGDAPRDTRTAAEMRAWARTAIDLAIARGEFDDLPLAGKPLPALAGGTVDPDWWLRGLIEREGLTGLAPPALSLRAESSGLHVELDRLRSEAAVRSHLDDFNARIVEARRQLSGGPPVVTPTRDVDAEVLLWHERRRARRAAEAAAVPPPPPSWRERRALRRELRRRRRGGADPAPTDAVPTGAAPTDAVPTDAAPTDAVPTDAVPTDAAPTGPAPTGGDPGSPADRSPA